MPAFIDEELQDLGKVDCIFYEFRDEENLKDFIEGIHKLQETVTAEASFIFLNSDEHELSSYADQMI